MAEKLLRCTDQKDEMQNKKYEIFAVQRVISLPVLVFLCCLGVVACAEADDKQTNGDIELGAFLSSTCVGCHSSSTDSSGIPPLETLSPNDIKSALNDYKSQTRDNATMRTIAASLSDQDVNALVAYFEQRRNKSGKQK